MSWDIDPGYPEPFEPQDSWAGGAGDGQRGSGVRTTAYRIDPQRPHPADCGCSAHGSPRPLSWWAVKDFGKERSSHASLGPTVVAATPGDSEDDRPTAPPPGFVKPPFVPGGGAGDGNGTEPEAEMDGVETAEQRERCGGYADNCPCPKGNA